MWTSASSVIIWDGIDPMQELPREVSKVVAIGSVRDYVVLASEEGMLFCCASSSNDSENGFHRQRLQEYEQYHQELMHTLFRKTTKAAFSSCLIQIELTKLVCVPWSVLSSRQIKWLLKWASCDLTPPRLRIASAVLIARGAFPSERRSGLRSKLSSLGVFPYLALLAGAGVCELWNTVPIARNDIHHGMVVNHEGMEVEVRVLDRAPPSAPTTITLPNVGVTVSADFYCQCYQLAMLSLLYNTSAATCHGGAILARKPYFLTDYLVRTPLSSLLHVLQKEARLSLMKKIARFLMMMHERGLVYRTLNLETISLSDDSALVFSGFSPLVNRSDVTESIFLAPEVLESDEHFSAASDVFAFGVVLYFSVTLRYPSRNAMVEGIPPQADCSSGLKKMIKRMWAEDPCGRPGLSEVFRVL